jgi:anti-sigma factor RsiW
MRVSPEEQVSALLDGELADNESPLVVRRVTRDEELKATALRYCLIGDAMRGDLPARSPTGLVERVRAEVGGAAAPGRPRPSWGRYAAGFGVAASVALLALVALPGGSPDISPVPVSSTEVAAPGAGTYTVPPASIRAASNGPNRLTRYYVNHSEYSSLMGGRGALSRIVISPPAEEDEPAPAQPEPVDPPR